MENISYVGLSYQKSLRQMMELTANNIANMTTSGFKAQDILFSEYIEHPRKGDPVSMVLDYSSFRRLEQGALRQTFNELDLAINGEGYFAVQGDEGIFYTRAGSFALSSDRQIITADGHLVLDDGNAPITIPEEATKISITADGTISTEAGVITTLKRVNFEDHQALLEVGSNLYDAQGQAELPADNAVVVQGMLEGSNVQPIVEMNRMIEILRAYQSAQRMMQTDHERIRNTIQKLTKV